MATAAYNISLADHLTREFYAWEKRGRGWQVWPFPVRPEPAFQPFHAHTFPPPVPVDDGRRANFFVSLADGVASFFGGKRPVQPLPPTPAVEELPEELDQATLVELVLQLPADSSPDLQAVEQLLICLGPCRIPVTLEIMAISGRISLQWVVDEGDAPRIRRLLESFFPELVCEVRAVKPRSLGESTRSNSLVVEFGLSEECMLPLGQGASAVDPYAALMAALTELRQGEAGIFQVLFEPVSNPWSESFLRAVTFADGTPFFEDEPEVLKETREKISKPLFAAVVRIAATSASERRTLDIARALTGAVLALAGPTGNALIPLSNDGYEDGEHVQDMLLRRSRRSGMILNSEELARFVHLPGADVQVPEWDRLSKRTKAAPAAVQGHALILGTNVHNNGRTPVTLSTEQRMRHMHVIGASGTGKSTFLFLLVRNYSAECA